MRGESIVSTIPAIVRNAFYKYGIDYSGLLSKPQPEPTKEREQNKFTSEKEEDRRSTWPAVDPPEVGAETTEGSNAKNRVRTTL